MDVIRSPFVKNEQDASSKKRPETKPSTSQKHKQEINQSLLSSQDDESDNNIYTITDTTIVRDQLPWSKSKELQTWKASKSKVIAQKSMDKDMTPKEVAKLRKSKSGQQPQDGKNTNWKCCLF